MGLLRWPIRCALSLAVLALVALPAASASAGTRVVGGTNASPGEFPYQVLLHLGPFQCGGSILNSTHVVTAAHCVEDVDSSFYPQIIDPSSITVFYGGVDRDTDGGGPDTSDMSQVGVSMVSVDRRRQRRLGGDEYDSALLTLSSAVSFDANTDLIPLANATELTNAFTAAVGDRPWITGWGLTDPSDSSSVPEILQKAQAPLVSDSTCQSAYGTAVFVPSVMVCAGTGSTDTCQGDSGGPLAVDTTAGAGQTLRLAGITSFGEGCAEAAFPGVYTEVPETGTTDFLTSPPSAPPSVLGTPHPTGTARVGQTVTCVPPSLPTGVSVTQYFWYAVDSADAFFEFSESGPNTVLPSATLGMRIVCDVRLENNGGYQYREGTLADAIGPVAANATSTPPATTPPPADTTKPTAKVRKVRCKRRKCTVTIKATDPGGIVKKVRARVRGKTRKCKRVAGKRRCKTVKVNRRLKLKKKGGGIYRGTIKLRRGTYVVSVVATDAAGNKSKKAKKKFRVR